MSITILKPGFMSSVQDLGRRGFQQYGVPIGGAMDAVAAAMANIICGNDENEAVIEMTLHGTEIMFNEKAYCAISGGGCKAYIDGVELPFNRLLQVPAFSRMMTKADKAGCRSYLAIAGGLDIKKEMGSASTYISSGIGGIQGRALITGDLIQFKDPHVDQPSLKILPNGIGISSWQVPQLVFCDSILPAIHLIKGPEFDWFKPSTQANFFNSNYTISLRSNRMGYRLEGQRCETLEKKEMVSTAVTRGIVQVTNEGDPIILMADAQTTGGYPRIARVCSADLPVLAQCRPGTKIQFREIGEEESETRYNKMVEAMKRVKVGLGNMG